jgi:hypothetical protein
MLKLMFIEKQPEKAKIRRSAFLKVQPADWELFVARLKKTICLTQRVDSIIYQEFVQENFSIFCNGLVAVAQSSRPQQLSL